MHIGGRKDEIMAFFFSKLNSIVCLKLYLYVFKVKLGTVVSDGTLQVSDILIVERLNYGPFLTFVSRAFTPNSILKKTHTKKTKKKSFPCVNAHRK